MLTNTYREETLKHEFQNADIANIGDAGGLRGSATAGSWYLSLHTDYPGAGGNQTTNECAYTSYARKAVARSSGEWAVSSGANPIADNVNAQPFPAATGGSEHALYCGLGTASSGAGNLKRIAALGSQLGPFVAESTNDTVTIKNHGLAVNDRIAFFGVPRGAGLPTGVTEGTVYFVKTVPDVDSLTLSATAGGATIDLTADGDGIAMKMVGLPIASGITPSFAAGTLDFFAD